MSYVTHISLPRHLNLKSPSLHFLDPSNFRCHLFRDSIRLDCDPSIFDPSCLIEKQGICRSNIALQLLHRKLPGLPIPRPYQLHLTCPKHILLRPSASHQVAKPTSFTGQGNAPSQDTLTFSRGHCARYTPLVYLQTISAIFLYAVRCGRVGQGTDYDRLRLTCVALHQVGTLEAHEALIRTWPLPFGLPPSHTRRTLRPHHSSPGDLDPVPLLSLLTDTLPFRVQSASHSIQLGAIRQLPSHTFWLAPRRLKLTPFFPLLSFLLKSYCIPASKAIHQFW